MHSSAKKNDQRLVPFDESTRFTSGKEKRQARTIEPSRPSKAVTRDRSAPPIPAVLHKPRRPMAAPFVAAPAPRKKAPPKLPPRSLSDIGDSQTSEEEFSGAFESAIQNEDDSSAWVREAFAEWLRDAKYFLGKIQSLSVVKQFLLGVASGVLILIFIALLLFLCPGVLHTRSAAGLSLKSMAKASLHRHRAGAIAKSNRARGGTARKSPEARNFSAPSNPADSFASAPPPPLRTFR